MADKTPHASWRPIEVKGGSGVDGGHAAMCACGEQSPFFSSSMEAADWWEGHAAPAKTTKAKA